MGERKGTKTGQAERDGAGKAACGIMGSSGEQGVSEGTGVWWQDAGCLAAGERGSPSERGQVRQQGGRTCWRAGVGCWQEARVQESWQAMQRRALPERQGGQMCPWRKEIT